MTPTRGSHEAPLLGRAVVCLSSIDWDFIWQGHQETMTRLARSGDPVLFIENTGVRSPALKDLKRLLHRLRNWRRGVSGFHEELPNLVVLSPIILPFPYAWWARRLNAWLITRAIRAWMRAVRCDTPVVWTFLPTPLVLDVIDALEPPAAVYYCVDNLQASSPAARHSQASEAELFRRADLVFVTSRELQKKALRHRREAHYFPFAVDFETFADCRVNGAREPEELAAIARPRCGYVGGVHHWIDFELLSQAAFRNPAVNFVMVGPMQTEPAAVAGLPNVHFLGPRPHERLPEYIKFFDVGLIPYRTCEFTESVYPTKLNEYLAMGIPVLSTDLPEVRAYNEENGRPVSIAADAREFSAAVAELTSRPSPDAAKALRIAAAQANGWTERLKQMAALIAEKLQASHAEAPPWPEVAKRLAWPWRPYSVAAAAALLLVFLRCTPLVWWLAGPLRLSAHPVAADAVIVLAGGAGESGVAGQGHEERLAQAIAFYRQGYVPRMLLCSGYVRAFREPDVMRDIAVGEGIPDEAILLSRKIGGTDKMIAEADLVVRRSGWKRVLLVSSPYHMRRAMLVWRKVDPKLEVVPTPAARSAFYGYREQLGKPPYSRTASFEQLEGILREYVTILYYRLSGRL